VSDLPSVRLYRPQGADRVAVVSIVRASQPGAFLVQVARGPRRNKLTGGGSYGPVPEEHVAQQYQAAVYTLRAEGFRTAGMSAAIAALKSKDAGVRARAALRLGWMREPEAVDALLNALPNAVDDVCSIMDALGMLGDARAVPAARGLAARKLLSRRRSGAEALRNLGDAEGLAEVKNRALERLPQSVRDALAGLDAEGAGESAESALIAAVQAVPLKNRGLVLDTLYELGSPAASGCVRAVLEKSAIEEPHLWRYAKSIHKRAALRGDHAMFGFLAHAIEARGRGTTGTTAKLKSGYDGEEKKTRVFSRGTQQYMRRSAWRHLRKLARHTPRAYPHAAAEIVLNYGPEDLATPKGLYGALSGCYALVRVLYGGGNRFRIDDRHLRFRFTSSKRLEAPAGVREESYPHLWDEEPRAYLRILGAARLVDAHEFAQPRLAGPHRAVLRNASVDEVIALCDAPYEPTVALGVEELSRRFDPNNPDFALLIRFLASSKPLVRDLGQRWLKLTTPLWSRDLSMVLAFLRLSDGAARSLAAELLISVKSTLDPALRRALAEAILAIFEAPEPEPGDHDALGRVAREALSEELAPMLSTERLLHFITAGSMAAKALAGDLLGRRPGVVDELGLERIVALAEHEVSAVRAAAHALILRAVETLKREPSLLFQLCESEWADTRSVAFDLLRTKIDIAALGLDGLIGLCDSNRSDVQDLGKELVRREIERDAPGVQPQEVLSRLVQHPHRNMRGFALDLAMKYLRSGFVQMSKIQMLCRAILFDLWPSRRDKNKVIDFLVERGLADERQAEVAAGILGDYVRTQGRADFERIMEGLVRLQMAYPHVESPVHIEAAAQTEAP